MSNLRSVVIGKERRLYIPIGVTKAECIIQFEQLRITFLTN